MNNQEWLHEEWLNQEWLNEIQWQDLESPSENVQGEQVYTVYLGDFLRMPQVNFAELSALDPFVRALLN